ncbi:hypothetical protein GCM10007874_07290 [Labrys miyagiensis]|uniref:TfuA-like core domain-containing protein n=1 Tax=Labrys miyagiensis TaxID=346912 RepID=A0ABQ6CG94_9HYPH|nr:TfuA-like protein [Labrys miyagiensis]GLS17714.1 hypothetical protein GCM10007874_07290 [Labrys miyagiensis]
MTRVVFAGPSLHGVDAALFEGFDMRPPAGCGDVLAAAMGGAEAIGLIDGIFDHALSVWHKEILHAIGQGIPVYGAASMGALRGAECAAYGMIGVGRIYEDYASGRRVADADVGVAHAPAELGHAPLSVALVDVEATLAAVRAADALPDQICEAILASARGLHFKERTWPDVVARAGLAEAAGVEAALERHACSQKQEDALALLARMRADAGEPGPVADFTLSRTGFFMKLHRRVEARLAHLVEGRGSMPV